MAARKTIVYVGSSNCRGLGTSILEAPAEAFGRWFGYGQSTFTIGQGSSYGVPGQGFPWLAKMSDVMMWTPRLPFMVDTVRPIKEGTYSGTTIVYTGAFVSTALPDSFVFVATNVSPGGQGNLRAIVSHQQDFPSAGEHTITVRNSLDPPNPQWIPPVVGGSTGTLSFFADSHTILSLDTDRFTITKTASTADFPGGLVGKIVVFPTSVGANVSRKIVAATATTITLDYKLAGTDPEPGDGIFLLLGANSCAAISDLANPANSAMMPLQISVDTCPVLRQNQVSGGGFGYSNIHNQPSVTNLDLTSNAVMEMMRRFRERFSETLYGLCMGRDSATISPYPIKQNLISLSPLYAHWQKSLEDLSFNPAVPFVGLYAAMFSGLVAMQLHAATANDTMEVEAFVILLAENDAQPVLGSTIDQIGQHMRTIRNVVRAQVNQPNMKFIMVGPSSIVWLPQREYVYEQLQAIADEDPWSEVVDTKDGMVYVVGENPPVHMNTVSQIELGKRIFDAYVRIVERNGETLDYADFVVEDGTAKADANALCTVEFADAYMASLEDPTEWRTATTKKKRDAIRRMSRWVSFKKFYLGQKVDPDQGMAFPRFSLTDENGFIVDSVSVPLRVQQATAYGAYRIVKGDWTPFPDEEPNTGTTSSSIGVGPISISESFAGPKQTSTEVRLPLVDQLLSIFVMPSVSVRIGRG